MSIFCCCGNKRAVFVPWMKEEKDSVPAPPVLSAAVLIMYWLRSQSTWVSVASHLLALLSLLLRAAGRGWSCHCCYCTVITGNAVTSKAASICAGKWNNGHVEDRGGEIAAREWGWVCFRRITDHFAHVILFPSCILLHIRLLTTFNSFGASELCKSGWNESSQRRCSVCLWGTLEVMVSIFFFFLSSGGSHLPPPPSLLPFSSRAPINRIELSHAH